MTIKKAVKIVLIFLLLFVVAAAAICITQWDNIEAAIIGLKYEQEEISQMQTDAKTTFAEKIGIDLDVVEKLAEQITPEGEVIEATPGNDSVLPSQDKPDTEKNAAADTPPKKPASSVPAKKPGKTDSSSGISHSSEDVELLLARFYALQSSYVGRLEGIKANAYAQYKALPKEQRGTNAKIRLGKQAVAEATALEAECDGKFNALLKELRSALTKAGFDQSLASEVRNYYASEKSFMKAQLMSKYKKYLS